MEHIDLYGFWLIGALVITYAIGVFTAQTVKDKVTGMPSDLRTILKATETNALAELSKARAAVLADIGNIFKKSAAAVAVPPVAPAPAPAPAPVLTASSSTLAKS